MKIDARRLLMVCPTSRKVVDTGVRLDVESWSDYAPTNGRSFCSHCAREHQWRKEWLMLEMTPESPIGHGG